MGDRLVRSVQIDRLSDGLDRVRLVDAPVPEPGPGQLRVRMRLSPVNPSDLNFIRGDYIRALERLIWNQGHTDLCYDPGRTQPSPRPPYSLGGEGVGIVDACGPGVPEVAFAGRRVAVVAGPPMGAWQDYTVVAAQRALPVPESVSDETAAMFIVNPLTAYAMVHEVLKVRADTWLMQDAAGSALARMVVRMSKLAGFRTINLVRGDAHREALAALGEAAKLAPDDARFAYVHGVALHDAGKRAEAMKTLEAALARHPYDRDILFALASYEREAGSTAKAAQRARLLVELEPDDAQLRRFAQELANAGAASPRR